jgi:hypothetical protein
MVHAPNLQRQMSLVVFGDFGYLEIAVVYSEQASDEWC